MGKCLVKAAKKRGHRVTWVDCPSQVESARELQKKLTQQLPKHDALIMAAAVCDTRPRQVSTVKIKKEVLKAIRLVKNPDILKSLAKKKKTGQVFIGFALESENILKNGAEKLKKKKLEAILIQRAAQGDTPFGDKKIDAVFLKKNGTQVRFKNRSKPRIADRMIREVESLF